MAMTYYAVTDDPNELAHWGIKGMKWGVRRTDAQLGHPRHPGSRRPRSLAYKKAQSKLQKMMKSGIKKAEAHWKAYNSPQAKEARFMKKAMQQARTGTLKYGKLTDDQVRRVTDRLALERNARQLGSTENPRYAKRLKMAVGEGIIRGIGQGTGAYIEERFRGRGRTTAEIKADKRKAKYESRDDVQRRKARNKQAEEFYNTAYEEGINPDNYKYSTANQRAKFLSEVKKRNKEADYRASIQKTYDEQNARTRAVNDAKLYDDNVRGIKSNREARKLIPSETTYMDPTTGKKVTGSKLQALNAWNTAHENVNTHGNAYYDSMNASLSRIKAKEAKNREQAQRDREYVSALRDKQRQDAAREVSREQARAARLEEVKRFGSIGSTPQSNSRPKRPGGPVHSWDTVERRQGESIESYAHRVNTVRNAERYKSKKRTGRKKGHVNYD